jgi:hypothetical protein
MGKRKRTLPPRTKRKNEGINPFLVAGGAAVGAAVGRVANRRAARLSVSRETGNLAKAGAALREWDMSMGSGPQDYMKRAAQEVHSREYKKMPRVNSEKLAVYNRLSEDSRKAGRPDYKGARKLAGLSNSDMNKVRNKINEKYTRSRGTADLVRSAGDLRARRTAGKAVRRGAAVGGLSAAAIQLIAAEVAKALKKK